MTDNPVHEVNLPRLWSELSYPGEMRVPSGISPQTGSWPTYFFKRNDHSQFIDASGLPLAFAIREPDTFNFEEQLKVVQDTQKNITPEQMAIARYWGDGPTPKQWIPIVNSLINTYHLSSPRAERMWGAAQAGVNDALVVTWYYKYRWLVPRPCQLDPELTTVLDTPKHPTYPAGHAVVAGCYQQILTYFFAPEAERLQALAEECAVSRLYAGVHFPADLEQGLRLGRQIGDLAVTVLNQAYDSDSVKVDYPATVNLHANLPPPPYVQTLWSFRQK